MIVPKIIEELTLEDLVRKVRQSRDPSRTAREVLESIILPDPNILIELVGIDEIRSRWMTLVGEGPTRIKPIAGKRPVVKVATHVRRPPLPRTITEIVADKVVLMLIDGVDLRDLTVGRCKTLAKKRGHEARVLRKIAEECAQIGDHVRIGDQYADAALNRIIEDLRTQE